ncbi:TSUP family transporter [Helicobacter sp. 11S02596-1]|uniref:sulfite exporter TauE/SafE family protein n=1 Tax=Helicobacter sp. 11S02596-1 TaxID=1476194 RepID=UPI000BA6EF20|nr:TSUP family transporter [Helicobacter sp. 11S02596-1]PAF45120.1 hypothetical protein BJI48_00695 [Helicobacter sp. 11S02596-1]
MYENIEFWVFIALCVAFFVAGFVDSIAGGGGLISMPSLLLAGISPQLALGTNKFVVIFGTAVALGNFIRHKKLIYKITLFSIGFSLIGAYVGTKLILLFDERDVASVILFLLPVSALAIFIPKKFSKTHQESFSGVQTFVYAPMISFFIGAYDGFFGPGTGTFLILSFYLFLRMDMLNAAATAKAINLASGMGSFFAFALSGHILYMLALPLVVANICGAYIGSKFAIKRGAKVVRIFVIFSFFVMFISLIFKYFFS